jgi:ParB/RepB/Spo0J family partition protein
MKAPSSESVKAQETKEDEKAASKTPEKETPKAKKERGVSKKTTAKTKTTTQTTKKTAKKKPVKKLSTAKNRNFTVKLTDIVLPERWNRDKPINLGSITTSIKNIGQVVAMTVRPDPGKQGKYILVDGRRRYMALQDLKAKEAIVSFTDGVDDTDTQIKALAANLSREGHNPMEVATVCSWIIDAGKTNKEIARAFGKSEGFISQHLALRDLDPAVQKSIQKGIITMSQARVLCKVNAEEHSNFFFKLYGKMTDGLKGQDADLKAQAYLDKYKLRQKAKAPKDSGTKGVKTQKKVTPKTDKKVGRPKTKIPNYVERKADIIPADKDTLLSRLTGYSERYARAKSPKSQNFIQGVLTGLEIAAGLKE